MKWKYHFISFQSNENENITYLFALSYSSSNGKSKRAVYSCEVYVKKNNTMISNEYPDNGFPWLGKHQSAPNWYKERSN